MPVRTCTFLLIFFAIFAIPSSLTADDPRSPGEKQKPGEAHDVAVGGDGSNNPATFTLGPDLQKAIVPFFESIKTAEVSRATVEMLADSILNGQVVNSQESTFQIASKSPDQFTIYLKEPKQRTRIYCDGKSMIAAMAPDAYFRLPEAVSIQDAVMSLSIPMGPYPEPLLALTMASADPAISLLAGMKSVEIVDRKDFKGKVPAVHVRGVQTDAVTWDLWISQGDVPKPLRLLVDLTPMLRESDQVHVPQGFSYQIRYDFLSWRVTGEVDDSLFRFRPATDATEYESLADYYETISDTESQYALLGKSAPLFKANNISGKVVNTKEFADRVVVLDFWTTWCEPCLESMPIIREVSAKFSRKGVVLLPINAGEDPDAIKSFLEEKKLNLNSLLDPSGKISDAFEIDSLPMTVVIGKSGAVESVHVGFAGQDALRTRLNEELEILVAGGKIGSVVKASKPKSPKSGSAGRKTPAKGDSK